MLAASINGVNEVESMNEGEEQIIPQRDREIISQGGEEIAPQEEEIEPPDW
jgi:hypothetical protein